MGKRPGRCYRNLKQRPPYTRKEYMGGVPGVRINQFHMGNTTKEFPVRLELYVHEGCLIRDIAIESARISANKVLSKKIGESNYHFKVMVYPHHILRENKQATGAGADRVSKGMRQAFGKAIGSAVISRAGQTLFSLEINPQYYKDAELALKKVIYKISSPCGIKVVKGEELLK
ncbi:MAG: 50S ribosomal protein L16 [Candidatus Methanoliparum thermophilum]|uniref:Large ribosomal subunit protein uL16 n=1 Tax=Methanoliparum thermophilum TaxID=2491083 RepID=A0A520KRK4_METT2|nr:50S ribosomal protein L16 [Candidatus Methanoliparum sp. LAM-1]RZN64269.1 MAG: 50S ribosomal protein L16 [Candidatus Methanoliparum thermophilum]BDC36665.1 50S ribosomal protein L16 [Candidatus Methanoliparum sp. LAM-1]